MSEITEDDGVVDFRRISRTIVTERHRGFDDLGRKFCFRMIKIPVGAKYVGFTSDFGWRDIWWMPRFETHRDVARVVRFGWLPWCGSFHYGNNNSFRSVHTRVNGDTITSSDIESIEGKP